MFFVWALPNWDVFTILGLLIHAKVESAKSKEAAEQRRLKKKGWLSFRWFVNILFSPTYFLK